MDVVLSVILSVSGQPVMTSALRRCFQLLSVLSSDESSPPKSPWGINIMKKSKKAGPKAFGVRLEDCQPGVNNKVSLKYLSYL